MSRAVVIRIPFLPKKTVLANMKAMNYDAKTADQLDLYNGTLSGTIKALAMKDAILEIKREAKRGLRGLAALFNPEILGGLAFDTATYDLLEKEETNFLDKTKNHPDKALHTARQKLVLYRALQRVKD